MTTFAEGTSALSGAFQTLLERCEAKERPLCYERHHAGYHGPVRARTADVIWSVIRGG